MNEAKLNQIIQALQSKGVEKPCARCGQIKFSVIGETNIPLQDDPNTFTIGGPSVPTILVGCDNCGNITQHASFALGLMMGSNND